MKKLMLGMIAVTGLGMATSANAADLPARTYQAPPVLAPFVWNWTGFYMGVNGGYGWSNQCLDYTAVNGIAFALGTGCRSAGGGVVGGQLGYRWQSGPMVFGVEAQGDWANLRNTRVDPFIPTNSYKSTINGIGLFTGQFGYAWNATLLYVKGGAAVANQRWDYYSNVTSVGYAQTDRTRWGGTVGAGIEFGFAPNWTVGLEYDFLWRVNDTSTFVTPALAPVVTSITANTRTDVNLFMARINYTFGGPVVY
jgi:outer membrane immunogenic protein